MKKTLLYQLTETSEYMMGFVIVTQKDNVIVIDGGRPADMPLLKEYIAGRHISAWILTHPHEDHISGFVDEIEKNGGVDFDIERIYYNFPPYEEMIQNTDVEDLDYYRAEVNEMLPAFDRIKPRLGDKLSVVSRGDTVAVDECRLDILYTWHRGLTANPINDASLAFKLTTPNKTVLFLGDLGPDGGDLLYRESRHLLKADIVQMAHHGHMNVGFEVYAAISPEVCLWCCPDWLWEEKEEPGDPEKLFKVGRIRMYGTAVTRQWMEFLGVREHYVTKDGTHCIEL